MQQLSPIPPRNGARFASPIQLARLSIGLLVLLFVVGGLFVALRPRYQTALKPAAPAENAVKLANSLKYLRTLNISIEPSGYLRPDPHSMWAPDGHTVAIAEWNNVRLFDIDTGRVGLKLGMYSAYSAPDPISWSPDRHLLAVSAYLGTISLLDPLTGRSTLSLTVPLSGTLPAISPVSGQPFSRFRVEEFVGDWSPKSDKLVTWSHIYAFDVDKPNVNAAQYVNYYTVQVWSTTSGELLQNILVSTDVWKESGYTGSWSQLSAITLSPDGGTLAVEILSVQARQNRTDPVLSQVQLWDMNAGKVRYTLSHNLTRDLLLGSRMDSFAWSPDGTKLAMSVDTSVEVVNVITGESESTMPSNISNHFVLPATPTPTATVQQLPWPISTGRPVLVATSTSTLPTPTSDASVDWPIERISWSPFGNTLAAYGWGQVRLLDASTGETKAVLRVGPYKRADSEDECITAWSPDGSLFATLVTSSSPNDSPRPIRLWDTATGHELRQLVDDARYMAWSPYNNTLAVIRPSSQDKIELWGLGPSAK